MRNRRNYYRILQVQPDAPAEIIHASYRTLMRELRRHPDLGGSTAEAAVLNEAYETLSDPLKRSAYDDALFRQYTRQTLSYSGRRAAAAQCPVCKRPLSRPPDEGEVCLTCQTPLTSSGPPAAAVKNNRTIARTPCSDPIEYYASWPAKATQGKMIDFSPRGMRFLCNERLMPQTILKISSRIFEASGTVTNLSEEHSRGKKCYAVGVCFLAVRFAESRGTFFSTTA